MAQERSLLMQVLSGLLSDMGRLSLLETELALRTLVLMVVLGIFMGVVGALCWLAVSAGLVHVGVIYLDLTLVWSIAVVTGLNVILLVLGSMLMRRLNHRLSLPATRRAVSSLSSRHQAADHPGQHYP